MQTFRESTIPAERLRHHSMLPHVPGAAFQDLFAGWRSRGEPVHEDWPMGLAMDAYRVADAMLKAREGGAA